MYKKINHPQPVRRKLVNKRRIRLNRNSDSYRLEYDFHFSRWKRSFEDRRPFSHKRWSSGFSRAVNPIW